MRPMTGKLVSLVAFAAMGVLAGGGALAKDEKPQKDSKEVQTAKKMHIMFTQQMGVHNDLELQEYVQRVGEKLAAVSERPDVIDIRIEEVFGNCPKYIQARAPEGEIGRNHGTGTGLRGMALFAPQRLAIETADTFFIASTNREAGADASHRGGPPGFVRVMDDTRLRFPDYAGNNMFQTLGNITTDPRVGLLFVDFDSGTTLQLTGRARILWDREDFLDLPGAERAVEVEIDEVVETAGQGPLGWRFLDYSPFNPR